MCTYTKIDPNAPEKEYKIILLEEEGNNRFSGKSRTCVVRKWDVAKADLDYTLLFVFLFCCLTI